MTNALKETLTSIFGYTIAGIFTVGAFRIALDIALKQRELKTRITIILATTAITLIAIYAITAKIGFRTAHAETMQYSGNTKKLNDETAAHGMDGFLDPTDGKHLTCKEAETFMKSHDPSITMPHCQISGKQAAEKVRKENRDITKSTWLDGCVEGSCRVGIWRDVHH